LQKPVLGLASACLLASCSGPPASSNPPASATPSRPAVPRKPAPPPEPPLDRRINAASLTPSDPNPGAGGRGDGPDPALVRAQVLLDRARFSPGAIDGRSGSNFAEALRAYQASHGLAATGVLDGPTFSALVRNDGAPVVQPYRITPQDEAGPFIGALPTGFERQARLPALGFLDPAQELAERFHMSESLLRALNPGVDFGRAGAAILVTVPNTAPLPGPVALIEVDKSERAVRAFGPDRRLLAVFPASVGSEERPAPSGELKVRGVAQHPTYTWDPKRVTFGPRRRHAGKLKIAAGPNNPVGVVWIALSRQTYGIHGAPDPDSVGKHQSHGCVRLTNWDAELLSRAVKPGVRVDFVGQDTSVRAD
jgi:lipoprotein-anchoring transpeptidase ErfK/SrfK